MFDIKWIRDNKEEFDQGMKRRGLEPQAAALIALHATRREPETLAPGLHAAPTTRAYAVGAARPQ